MSDVSTSEQSVVTCGQSPVDSHMWILTWDDSYNTPDIFTSPSQMLTNWDSHGRVQIYICAVAAPFRLMSAAAAAAAAQLLTLPNVRVMRRIL